MQKHERFWFEAELANHTNLLKTAIRNGQSLNEGFAELPRVWKYALLRGSLRSRVDQYPEELFWLMLALGKEAEVLELAELLNDPVRKIEVLLQVLAHLKAISVNMEQISQLLLKAQKLACTFVKSGQYSRKLYSDALMSRLMEAFFQHELWEQALEIASVAEDDYWRARVCNALAAEAARQQQWERAQLFYTQALKASLPLYSDAHGQESALSNVITALAQHPWEHVQATYAHALEVVNTVEGSGNKVSELGNLAASLAQQQQWEQSDALSVQILEIARTMHEDHESVHSRDTSYSIVVQLVDSLARHQQWERVQHFYPQILALTSSIQKAITNAYVLRKVADSLMQHGQWEQARKLYIQALTFLSIIESFNTRIMLLDGFVRSLAQYGRWEQVREIFNQVLELVNSFEDRDEKTEILGVLVEVLAQCQQWEQACALAYSLQHKGAIASALKNIAMALDGQQQWDQAWILYAQALVLASGERKVTHETASDFVQSLLRQKRYEQALEIIDTIEDQYYQIKLLSGLALSFAQNKQEEQARGLYERALTLVNSIDVDYQPETLSKIAETLAQQQLWDQAIAVAQTVQNDSWVNGSLSEGSWQVSTLSKIAELLAQHEQWERALAIFSQALEAARSIRSDCYKSEGLGILASSLVYLQAWEQVQALCVQALEIAGVIQDNAEKSRAMCMLGGTFLRYQQWEQARNIYLQALEIARFMNNDSSWKTTALLGFTISLHEQPWEQIQLLYPRALEVAASAEEGDKDGALSILAESLAQHRQWKQALEIVRSITQEHTRSEALRALIEALAGQQQLEEQELEVLRACARDINFEVNTTNVRILSTLIGALTGHQQWEQARTFYAEACSIIKGMEKDTSYALCTLAEALAPQRWEQAQLLYAQALEISCSIADAFWGRAPALRGLIKSLAQQQWKYVQPFYVQLLEAACALKDRSERVYILSDLVQALARQPQLQTLPLTLQLLNEIGNNDPAQGTYLKASILSTFAIALDSSDVRKLALQAILEACLHIETRGEALKLFPLMCDFKAFNPEIGRQLYEAMQWVDTFISGEVR